MNTTLATAIKQKARDLGFELVGITGAEPSVFAVEYRDWIARGYAGEMGYLTRNLERRLDPRELLPNTRSIIVVGMNYYTEEGEAFGIRQSALGNAGEAFGIRHSALGNADQVAGVEQAPSDTVLPLPNAECQTPHADCQPPNADRAIFARYARGDDYHDVMGAKLRELLAFLKEQQPFVEYDPELTAAEAALEIGGEMSARVRAQVPTEGRVYVDTGPILEREVARRAGLGWFGKNTMLINTRRGSYFFLGEIITNLPLPVDVPAIGGCGTCTRCIDACPTGAIVAPYVLDATRCISYLTIELKGAIPEEHRPAIAATNRIYGCDICQEVCPFNRLAASSANPTLTPTTEPAFQARPATTGRTLAELALLTEEEFREQFNRSPVKRAKWRGLLRNVAIALAVSDDPEAERALEQVVASVVDPLVKEHARWAVEQIRERKGSATSFAVRE